MERAAVSACLVGCCCKYSGGSNLNHRVLGFLKHREFITFCPEVDGGLSTPRPPAEIQGGEGREVLAGQARVVTKDGKDVTAFFLTGARQALKAVEDFGPSVVILKERSPSCGVNYIYDGSFSGTVISGAGVTGAALAQQGIQVYTEENLPWGWCNLDYQQITEKLVDWLRLKAKEAGAKGYVVGLSGGIDSAVTAALIKRAFPDNALGVVIPIESAAQDREDALLVAESLGLEIVEAELSGVFRAILDTLEPGIQLAKDNLAAANVKPRLRMLALYYYAARRGALVAGTGNKSELVSGFFTKYGDGAVDVEPLGELVKTEIWELARHLGIPQRVIDRVPSAGLWPDQTDEGELGFSYQELDEYIRTGKTSPLAQAKIEVLARKIQHKLEPPPVCPL